MRRLRLARALLAAGLLARAAGLSADELVHQVGQVVMRVDTRHAFPGGVLLVRVSSAGRVGGVSALLDGKRTPLQPGPGGLRRGLLPIPLGTPAGWHTLGFEVATRSRRGQRVPLQVGIDPRKYPGRAAVLPANKLGLLNSRDTLRDARRLLQALQAFDPGAPLGGPLRAPVAGVTGVGFGSPQLYAGVSRPIELLKDAQYGEEHRGLDYDVPVGTAVSAPGAGRVLLATWLQATGWTVVIDHGLGVVSALFHLSEVSARTGEVLDAGSPLGRSGETGLASHAHVHWGVYLNGVAVDPSVLITGFEG